MKRISASPWLKWHCVGLHCGALCVGPLLMVSVFLAACGMTREPFQHLTATLPATPANVKEYLMSEAIRRAVVEQRDIEGYDLLPSKHKIVVSSVTMTLSLSDPGIPDTLGAGALPASEAVQFVLLPPEGIQRLADQVGDFVYLQPGATVVAGDTAVVEIGTVWKAARGSRMVYLSGGGYQLRYVREADRWRFDRVLGGWVY